MFKLQLSLILYNVYCVALSADNEQLQKSTYTEGSPLNMSI